MNKHKFLDSGFEICNTDAPLCSVCGASYRLGIHHLDPTLTMKIRGRLVTLEEAKISVGRLINSHFHNANSARVQIPANPSDDDLIATDYLYQQDMTAQTLVEWLKPGAHLRGLHHGKVYISDDDGNDLSDVMYLGTSDRRREDAWQNALERLQTCK